MMQQRLRTRVTAIIGVTLASALLAYGLSFLSFTRRVELASWDLRVKLTKRSAPNQPITVIEIDQTTLERLSQDTGTSWPLPRQLYAPVLRYFQRANAKVVAFDLLFTEPSSYGVADDRMFIESHPGPAKIVHAAVAGRNDDAPGEAELTPTLKSRAEALTREGWFGALDWAHPKLGYRKVLTPEEEFQAASAQVGNVTEPADLDGTYRHAEIGRMLGGVPLLSFAFAIHKAGNPEASYEWLRRYQDDDGWLIPRFRERMSMYGQLNLLSIIENIAKIEQGQPPAIDPKMFEGAYILIGATAPGLLDLRPTSVDPLLPGVYYHAVILDNILRREFVSVLPYSFGVVALVLLTGAVAALTITAAHVLTLCGASVGLCAAWAAACVLGAGSGWWLPLTMPLLGGAFAAFGGLGYRYGVEGRAHRFVRRAFGQYVGQDVIEQILKDPSKLQLGGERRELSVFFSDLAGFTSLSEKLDPHALVQLLNEYLSAMTDVILSKSGTLDKYVGDAIVCFWNAPIDVERHAAAAVGAGLECTELLQRMQSTFQAKYGVDLGMRIGVFTGEATVGNFGSTLRFDYTAIGDVVNIASRLEGANKFFGTTMLVGARTRQLSGEEHFFRPVGKLILVGKGEPVEAFEPIAPSRLERDESSLRRFCTAYGLLSEGDLQGALKVFESLSLSDKIVRRYVERLRTADKGLPPESYLIWKLDEK